MSWIRLLNTSRSFSGQDVEPRGYRLTQMNLIPKFGTQANAGASAPAKTPFVAPAAPPPVAVVPSPPKRSEWPSRVITVARVSYARATELCGRLLRRHETPFAARTSSTDPTGREREAQPELKLEAIRPVHNDLSDCDFEVRPVRLAGPEPEPVVAQEPAELAMAGEAPGRVHSLLR